MPTYLPFVLAGLVVAGLAAWAVTSSLRKSRARKAALDQVGFIPCPDRQVWLEQTVTRMESRPDDRYEVREPRRLRSDPEVYYYIKMRHGRSDDPATAEEEILFPLERKSAASLRLLVKPSSLAHGLATRILSSLVSHLGSAASDQLQPIELPRDLGKSNVLAALGPRGASLYDLVDSGTLAVLQGLGDAGGIFVHLQDGLCAVAGPTGQFPFRADEVVTRIRPLR